jgi:hypothetical protein
MTVAYLTLCLCSLEVDPQKGSSDPLPWKSVKIVFYKPARWVRANVECTTTYNHHGAQSVHMLVNASIVSPSVTRTAYPFTIK